MQNMNLSRRNVLMAAGAMAASSFATPLIAAAPEPGKTVPSSWTDAARPQLTHRIVDANGTRVHVVEQGAGPLVLLCHGFPECWYSWRHQL